jgi:hypothetical protein
VRSSPCLVITTSLPQTKGPIQMRPRTTYACLFALAACVSFLCGAALGGRAPGTKLSSADMARLSGSSPEVGTCSGTCAAYQAAAGNQGTWDCTLQPNNTLCDLCQMDPQKYTWPGRTGLDCPGFNQKPGAVQQCGKQSAPFSATCQGGKCQGNGQWDQLLNCSNPPASVNQ